MEFFLINNIAYICIRYVALRQWGTKRCSAWCGNEH